MNKKVLILFYLLFLSPLLFAQNSPKAYIIYNAEGEAISWETFIEKTFDSKVILFGEKHDDKIGHWLEYEFAKAILNRGENWILGAEMIEFDQQSIVDEYLHGFIVQSSFEEDTRLWPNYADYKPLVELAKKKGRAFIATNIPRRYARTVYYYGLDTINRLEDVYKKYLPNLPITIDSTLESYAALQDGMMMAHTSEKRYLMQAQAIKDAVMAHNICVNIQGDKKLLHFNGSYHSDNYEGINVYLKEFCNPSITTISMTSSAECKFPDKLQNIADFIILTNKNFTNEDN